MSKVVYGLCDRCERFTSKRDGMTAEVRGVEKFICADCADYFQNYFNLTRGERAETFRWFMEGAI